MAMYTTGLANFGANVLPTVWVERTFVPVLRSRLQLVPLGRESSLIENNGKTVRWNIFTNPAADSGTVAEGGTPTNDTQVTTTAITATLSEYGGYSEFSKFLVRTAISGTMEEIIQTLAYKAALSLDVVCMDGLVAASPTSIDAGVAMTADALRRAVADLQGAGQSTLGYAAGHVGAVEPHPKSPGGAFYCFVASPEAAWDMIGEGAPTWSQAKNDQIESNLRTPLEGTPASSAIYQAIVKITDAFQRDTGTAPDNDLNYLIGKDAFGTVSLASNIMRPEVRVVMPDERIDRVLRNVGYASYWLLFASSVIDANRFTEVLSDATGIG